MIGFAWTIKAKKRDIRRSILQPNTKLSIACSGNQKHLRYVHIELYTFKSPFPFILPTAYLVLCNNVYKTASLTMVSSAAGITSALSVFLLAIFYSLPSARPSPLAEPRQCLLVLTA